MIEFELRKERNFSVMSCEVHPRLAATFLQRRQTKDSCHDPNGGCVPSNSADDQVVVGKDNNSLREINGESTTLSYLMDDTRQN